MNDDKLRKNLKSQSFRFFNAHYNGIGKNKSDEPDKLRSHTSFYKHVEQAAFAAENMGVKRLKHITPELAQEYLENRKNNGICQKSLAFEKKMLERIISIFTPITKLNPVIESKRISKPKALSNRAYTKQQTLLILARQTPYTQLSTQIAFNAGLRAFELLTIQRSNEASPSPHRNWRSDLFKGRDEGVAYIVTGKGGLSRTVILSTELSNTLEQRRLDEPRVVEDRYAKKVLQFYDISGGHKFSRSFSKASMKALGWSMGAHGSRFTYAQERMDNNIKADSYEMAKTIISQELGHFRPEITERYLKP
ncbi:MAG: integrase [Shewanella oncorhynchi]